MFFTEYENTLKFPNADTAIAISKLAPITSSIENALFLRKSCNTVIEFTNIL